MKKLLVLLSAFLLSPVVSYALDFELIFKDKNACFILYDLNKMETIKQYGNICNKRSSPMSTFKVPLSLMGFDAGILANQSNPKWEYKEGYLDMFDVWKQPHNPKSWMQYSVVWYSQVLAQKLGMPAFEKYIRGFDYGNMDISGDTNRYLQIMELSAAGKSADIDDTSGLTNAWLNNSLKISPNEQLIFLKKLVKYQLPVSEDAINKAKEILFRETLANGWRFYGKTGSGMVESRDKTLDLNRRMGWDIGWVEKDKQMYLFVLHFQDKYKEELSGGLRAKEKSRVILNEILSGS